MNSVDLQNIKGDTALHLSIRKLNFDLALRLIEVGADLNIQNKMGFTFLDMCYNVYDQMVEKIIGSDNNFDVFISNMNLMNIVINKIKKDNIIERKYANGDTLLIMASCAEHNNKIDLVEKLIIEGADVCKMNIYGKNVITNIFNLCKINARDICGSTLGCLTTGSAGIFIGRMGGMEEMSNHGLYVKRKAIKIIENIKNMLINIDFSTTDEIVDNIFEYIKITNSYDILSKKYLNNKYINYVNINKETILMKSVQNNSENIKILCDCGCDITMQNNNGDTAFMIAIETNNKNNIDVLFDLHLKIDTRGALKQDIVDDMGNIRSVFPYTEGFGTLNIVCDYL